jgi:predicted transcriptional regulator
MKNTKAKKPSRTLTVQQRAQLRRQRRKIAQELPELIARNQLSKEAKDEPTLSGELRRAIHSSELSLADLATQAAIPPLALDEFLTGERTLRSDVLDRLAASLKMVLGPRG